MRREALRTIGVLGALDPFRQWQIQSQLNRQSSEEIAEVRLLLFFPFFSNSITFTRGFSALFQFISAVFQRFSRQTFHFERRKNRFLFADCGALVSV